MTINHCVIVGNVPGSQFNAALQSVGTNASPCGPMSYMFLCVADWFAEIIAVVEQIAINAQSGKVRDLDEHLEYELFDTWPGELADWYWHALTSDKPDVGASDLFAAIIRQQCASYWFNRLSNRPPERLALVVMTEVVWSDERTALMLSAIERQRVECGGMAEPRYIVDLADGGLRHVTSPQLEQRLVAV